MEDGKWLPIVVNLRLLVTNNPIFLLSQKWQISLFIQTDHQSIYQSDGHNHDIYVRYISLLNHLSRFLIQKRNKCLKFIDTKFVFFIPIISYIRNISTTYKLYLQHIHFEFMADNTTVSFLVRDSPRLPHFSSSLTPMINQLSFPARQSVCNKFSIFSKQLRKKKKKNIYIYIYTYISSDDINNM